MKDFGKFPKIEEEFLAFLLDKESESHDYNSIAEALCDTTLAFFNYFACKHGMTNFQTSWAQLRFIGKARGYEAPFMIVDSSKMLFPQYDILSEVEEFLTSSKDELSKIAKNKLENEVSEYTHPNVVQRWEELAAWNQK